MATLSAELKDFLETNIELINNRQWEELYDNAVFTMGSEPAGELTRALLSAGIHPLDDIQLKTIPQYFFTDAPIKTCVIPPHIDTLGEGCFSYSKIEQLVIPKTVNYIGEFAFYDCANLKKVVFDADVADIGQEAFNHCPNVTVYCEYESTVDRYCSANGIKVRYI